MNYFKLIKYFIDRKIYYFSQNIKGPLIVKKSLIVYNLPQKTE